MRAREIIKILVLPLFRFQFYYCHVLVDLLQAYLSRCNVIRAGSTTATISFYGDFGTVGGNTSTGRRHGLYAITLNFFIRSESAFSSRIYIAQHYGFD